MRSPLIHVATILLIIGLCQSKAIRRDLDKEGNTKNDEHAPESTQLDDVGDSSPKEDTLKEDQPEEELPILPPIILLDFGNDTDDENVTSDEKSKRTVNNGLGYGLEKNSLQPRRHNYYFPSGKSGTTVSIEESITPFLPKTIVEKVQPSNHGNFFGGYQNSFSSTYSGLQSQGQSSNPQQSYKSQFGLRTKPQKSAMSFSSYQNFLTIPKPTASPYGVQNSGFRSHVSTTTQSPLSFSATEPVRYVTAANYANSGSIDYVTPGPFYNAGQRQNVRSNVNPHAFGSVSQSVATSTVSPVNYNSRFASSSSQSSTKPRYTVENGVQYENKVFWKYPDGRVSDVPPATYVETSYPEYSPQQPPKSQTEQSIYESSSTENSVLSQGPVQFPSVPDQNVEPTPFVSSESLSSSLPQQQAYRLGYQNLLSQKQNLNLGQQRKPSTTGVGNSYPFSSPSEASSDRGRPGPTSVRSNYETQYQETASRYLVNSPSAEYTDSYVTEPTVNATTPVSFFASSAGAKKQSYSNPDVNSYSNLRYSDLLNYNPSISEYIRNPSSILNVHPTFVQAGNSLVPVIILRVDGASPIQSKAAQNVNLKALLQQYLVQYANSIQELTRPSTYDLGSESSSKVQSSVPGKSPVLDLIRLTQQDARDTPSYSPDSYIGRSSYETSNVGARDFAASHLERSLARQKVKNVQILDDSGLPSYKFKN